MSVLDEIRRERAAGFAALRAACPTPDSLPHGNSDPRVRLRKGEHGDRYYVYFEGHKIGWLCRPVPGTETLDCWSAYLVDRVNLAKGVRVRADGSKRRYALADLLFEAWRRASW